MSDETIATPVPAPVEAEPVKLSIEDMFDMLQGTLLNLKGYIKGLEGAYKALQEENVKLKDPK